MGTATRLGHLCPWGPYAAQRHALPNKGQRPVQVDCRLDLIPTDTQVEQTRTGLKSTLRAEGLEQIAGAGGK
eukprot:8246115-Lingulodinium_polyedra.AAC.1